MAIARPRRLTGPAPAARPDRSPAPGIALPVRPWLPVSGAIPADPGVLRRCTYRQLTPLRDSRRGAAADYAVGCGYPRLEEALPLGTLATARAICAGCTATGIFRADED